MFTIRYNRTTNHIAGMEARTTGGGNESGGMVSNWAQNVCGAMTRSRLATGPSFETLGEALAAARKLSGRKVCKTCAKAAETNLTAE
jgi:hypothetical protein